MMVDVMANLCVGGEVGVGRDSEIRDLSMLFLRGVSIASLPHFICDSKGWEKGYVR